VRYSSLLLSIQQTLEMARDQDVIHAGSRRPGAKESLS
jgi:hypothetical protein